MFVSKYTFSSILNGLARKMLQTSLTIAYFSDISDICKFGVVFDTWKVTLARTPTQFKLMVSYVKVEALRYLNCLFFRNA